MLKETVWYHGTNESSALSICDVGIDFSKSKKELDFGIGFYLTDNIDVARKRAISQTRKYNRIYHKNDKPAIVTIVINEGMFENLSVRNADSDISGLAAHIEDGDLTFKDISVYDVLTDKGTPLGLQISLHTMRSLSSVVSKSYEVIEGRNK